MPEPKPHLRKRRPLKPLAIRPCPYAKNCDACRAIAEPTPCDLIAAINKDLRHFKAEIEEHEEGALNAKRAKDEAWHNGQVVAYRHIVKHLEELVKC